MKKFLIVPLFFIAIFSCTKTNTITQTITQTDTITKIDTVNTVMEMPFKAAIAAGQLVDTGAVITSAAIYEQGNVFYSSENGVISKLGAIFPTNGTYRVTLWDYLEDTLIVSANVNCTDSTQFAYTTITPVSIIANHKYMISNNTNANPYYSYQLKSYDGLAYPYSARSITILDFYYGYPSGTNPEIPTLPNDGELINADFVFKAN